MFEDRREAGIFLAQRLRSYVSKNSLLVALPRGGVVVAHEVSYKFKLPLFVFHVRKIGLPTNPEFGIGAISESGEMIINKKVIKDLKVSDSDLEKIILEEKKELARRIKKYNHRLPEDLPKKEIIIIDDGLATGNTAKVALFSLRKFHPKKLVFASPVCAIVTKHDLTRFATHIVCVLSKGHMDSIGKYYKNFKQVTDREVIKILKKY